MRFILIASLLLVVTGCGMTSHATHRNVTGTWTATLNVNGTLTDLAIEMSQMKRNVQGFVTISPHACIDTERLYGMVADRDFDNLTGTIDFVEQGSMHFEGIITDDTITGIFSITGTTACDVDGGSITLKRFHK